VVRAIKAGDNQHHPVESTPFTITVGKRNLSNATISISPVTYRGSAWEPTPIVTDSVPISDFDYTVSHSNNINAGTATVTIAATSAGNYTGSISAPFTINRAVLSVSVAGGSSNIPFGSPIPAFTPRITGFLGSDTEHSVVSGQPTFNSNYTPDDPVGDYWVRFEQGSLNADNYTFEIIPRELSVGRTPQTIPLVINDPGSRTWGQDNNTFNLTTTGGNGDGAVTYRVISGNVEVIPNTNTIRVLGVGTGRAVIEAVKASDGNFAASEPATIEIIINRRPLSNVTTFSARASCSCNHPTTCTFDGRPHNAFPNVSDGSIAIRLNDDYTVASINNTNAGTATVTITATETTHPNGNYEGSISLPFTIGRRNLSRVNFVLLNGNSFTYNGNVQISSIGVSDSISTPIRLGTDFAVSYSNPNATNAGDYSVTITGNPTVTPNGNYEGAVSLPFTIHRAPGGAVNGTISVQSLSFGNGSITIPHLSATTNQSIEYGICDGVCNFGCGPVRWVQSTTITELHNRTYHVWARTIDDGNNFTYGVPHYVGIVPHNGWAINVGGNFTNNANGMLSWAAQHRNENGVFVRQELRTGSGNLRYWNHWDYDTNFAPWTLNHLILDWGGTARLRIANVQIRIIGHHVNIHRDFGEFDSNNGRIQAYPMTW
jgi:hypothetical protein